MELPQNRFKDAIRQRRKQVGLWVSLASNFSAEVVAHAGFDWVVIDMEHSPNEVMDVVGQLQAFQGTTTTPLVRPMWNDSVVVKRLLDIGAPGLVFPMVQSVEEARAAVSATRYPPGGIRGVAGNQRANAFGRIKDYFKRVEEETCVIVQIESRAAMAQAREIASVDGVDGVFFGPADIAADMGMLGQPAHPDVWEAIMPAARAVMDAGKPVGTLISDMALVRRLFADGFTFIAVATDLSLLIRGVDQALAEGRDATH
ncbi:MAG: aldolase/citrate lyase family protein [Rhizobiaceae bacterium]